MGGASASLSALGKSGSLTARIVAGMQLGADTTCVAVFSNESYKQLKAFAQDPESATFTRLLGFFMQLGMNGMMLFGMKQELALPTRSIPKMKKRYPNFTKFESTIIEEIDDFMHSSLFENLRAAHKEGKTLEVDFQGLKVLYQHDHLYSEGYNLGADAFMIGPLAFKSEQELTKTLLHERFRNHFDPHSSLGVGESTKFTKNADGFARNAYIHIIN